MEAHVHKTTYGPLIDAALYVIVLMRANPLLGGGGICDKFATILKVH